MKRVHCISVLLLIIVSHSMAGVHAVTHAQADLTECQLCAAYADPSDAIPAAEVPPPPIPAGLLSFQYLDKAATPASVFAVYPRGPPLSI